MTKAHILLYCQICNFIIGKKEMSTNVKSKIYKISIYLRTQYKRKLKNGLGGRRDWLSKFVFLNNIQLHWNASDCN